MINGGDQRRKKVSKRTHGVSIDNLKSYQEDQSKLKIAIDIVKDDCNTEPCHDFKERANAVYIRSHS